jgi:type IV pilus assembly protein PilW
MMRRPRHLAAARRQQGFSLVELIVSVVIGLLALLFALNMVGGAEKTRRSALGGSDEMQNGMMALFSLSNDAGDAGFGLNDPIVTGCNTVFYDSDGNYALAPATSGSTAVHPLAPVVIEAHGASPDRITFYSGSANGGTPSLTVGTAYVNGATISISGNPFLAFNQKDVIVVAPTSGGGNCAMAQISSVPKTTDTTLKFAAAGGYNLNSGNLGAPFAAAGARVFNLGQIDDIAFRSWSVSDGYLQLQELRNSLPASTVSDNIVSIKAEYGFDTRVGTAFTPALGARVSSWSPTMIDADGSGVVGDAGDYQHIAAVRLAVVARSKAAELKPAGVTCTATATKPTVFSAAIPTGAAVQPIQVDVSVAGDPVAWQCYRYRVFETVVMLRNAAWRP